MEAALTYVERGALRLLPQAGLAANESQPPPERAMRACSVMLQVSIRMSNGHNRSPMMTVPARTRRAEQVHAA
jgi:hypothetical protein